MRIAVFANENSSVCDFFEARRFIIWQKGEGAWRESAAIDFAQIVPSTPPQIRKEMNALLPLVEDCEVIAGGALTGIPYVVFDQAGKHIFQIDEVNDEILDGIMEDIDDALSAEPVPHTCNPSAGCNAACSKQAAAKISPEEIAPGVYHFNLIALQRTNPEISSKQALREFMDTTPFSELNLMCMHVPPWIEREFNVQQEGVSCKITPR